MSFSINRTGGVRPGLSAVVLVLSVALTGCGGGTDSAGGARSSAVGTAAPAATSGTTQARPSRPSADTGTSGSADSARPPGLGPRTLAAIPAKARQVVLVTGRGRNSPISEVALYRRTDTGWAPGAEWPAHNALRGWTDDHHAGDLRSPIGVFALTDAGGLLADPGSKLPYDRSGGFTTVGTGFEGEPLAGSFDYVVAINYNREPGTSPLDWTRPLGAGRGGGIWLHVDHGGPTHGCVSLAQRHMKELLLTLDPAQHPVVVMGDATSLTR
ncbi:L,D-transpeptidase family protein [Streptomyces sp. NPDC051643]|uniref:L,D-transpeptidase family protein n=1 Tax=Streptomyces sp. NPDC051643 TaxID=3365665 RepID=UPI0037A18FFE